MANVALKIEKSAVTPKSLKAGEYPFKGVSVGKWNIPATDSQAETIIGFLELNASKGVPIRLPATSLGFAKIGVGKDAKTITEALGDKKDSINPSDQLGGAIVVTIVDGRANIAFKGITSKQLLG